MKKIIIILILIGFFSVSEQQQVAKLRTDLHSFLSTELTLISEFYLRLSGGVQQDIIDNVDGLTLNERRYLISAFDSMDKTRQFYRNYCQQKDINPYIYGANLNNVCSRLSMHID